MRTLDHLVYAVPDLHAALDWFEEHAGLRPAIGGRHLHQGTHNAVVNLGQGAYLEIVAPDPENTSVPPPRWMGVDLITKPRLVRWSLKSNDLTQDAKLLKAINPTLGHIHAGQRELPSGDLLRWQMTLPSSTPAVDLIPFFLDWSTSDFHPTDRMPEQFTCKQVELKHPEPKKVAKALRGFGMGMRIEYAPIPAIIAIIGTPKETLALF